MQSVCLYFKVHIPCRLTYFPAGKNIGSGCFFDSTESQALIDTLAEECYLPANKLMQELIESNNGKFKIAFSISGTAIELLQQYRPDVLQSFKKLAATGAVEFLAETYYQSLSWLHSKKEFQRQVLQHHQKIEEIFYCTPVVFKNTELMYNNDVANFIAAMGYKGILCEGLETILNGRSPNQIYAAPDNTYLGVLLRNTRLSDDIAFRFNDSTWNEQPLTAEKFAGWIHGHEANSNNINLYFDYETFGIHKKKETGIFEFLQNLPFAILSNENWIFKTPAEVLEDGSPKDIFDTPQIISWQNKSFENCIWSENTMQRNALHKIYQIENTVQQSNCARSLKYWGYLQSADHFYSMSQQENDDNGVYASTNIFRTAHDVYEYYKNIVTAFELYLIQQGLEALRDAKRNERSNHLYAGTN